MIKNISLSKNLHCEGCNRTETMEVVNVAYFEHDHNRYVTVSLIVNCTKCGKTNGYVKNAYDVDTPLQITPLDTIPF